MSTYDIKIRIHDIVDRLPEDLLPQVLFFMEEIESISMHKDRVERTKEFISRNRELLKRLAEE